ncbi:MAG TPA: MBL fold metallo-hydrolase [Actinomycetota bacterium]|nr:MBL fold metallo-hydrolase [Actinomycetota bacterium]
MFEIFSHHVVGPLQCNCYVVGDPETKQAIVIDPGDEADVIAASLAERELTVTAIVATHAHFDHVVAAGRLRELTGAPFYLHRDDGPILDWLQESGRMFLGLDLPPPPDVDREASEGEILTAGSARLEVLHTPGHSPGSISLVTDTAVFSGDTLFAGSIGRTDLPGGDTQELLTAVRNKLFLLEDELPVYPGHGPQTTLGEEKRFNPFVGLR